MFIAVLMFKLSRGKYLSTWRATQLQMQILIVLFSGAYEGGFPLGCCGRYIRETGVWILFLFSSGRDMHSGQQVSIQEQMRNDPSIKVPNEFWESAGKVNRGGLVVYPPPTAPLRQRRFPQLSP